MEGDELGAVGEGRLDLDLVEHLGDALHHVVGVEHLAAGRHELGDGAAVAGRLEHPDGEQRDRLGVVEPQAACRGGSRATSAATWTSSRSCSWGDRCTSLPVERAFGAARRRVVGSSVR